VVATEAQVWRQQINQLFHDARTELGEILSALDELTLPSATTARVSINADVAMQDLQERHTVHRREPAETPPILPPEQREPIPQPVGSSDFSERLDSLKRKLNQRIQDQTPLAETPNSKNSKPDEAR